MTTTDLDGGGRAATLADVAAASGVAISTASRALSNPSRVNVRTLERVRAAAQEVGYRAPRAARPADAATRMIAVLVSDIGNPFHVEVIRGAQRQLRAAGARQLLVDTQESAELEASTLRSLAGTVDGAVVAAPRLPDGDLAALADALPFVAINRRPRGVPHVLLDTPGGVTQALEHLVSLGHRDLVYIGGPASSWSNERRWRSLERTAARLGVAIRRVGPFAPTRETGHAAADVVLNTGATGCLVFNDLLAIGMLGRFRERGVAVPGDISVVGCDDTFGADFCDPPLTTVHAPIQRAGEVAVGMLLDGGARDEVVLPTTLVIRASTGPVSTSEPPR